MFKLPLWGVIPTIKLTTYTFNNIYIIISDFLFNGIFIAFYPPRQGKISCAD